MICEEVLLLSKVPSRAPFLMLGQEFRAWAEPSHGKFEDSRQATRSPLLIVEDISQCT